MSIRLFYIVLMISNVCCAIPPINLFRPSDRPLFPDPVSTCWNSQTSLTYEGSFHIKAFRDTEEDELDQRCRALEKKACVLDLYQEQHNVLAAFKGFDAQTPEGLTSSQFNLNDEAGTQGKYTACGSLSVPLNLMFSYRYYFDYGLRLELHLPLIHAELKDVFWRPLSNEKVYEGIISQNLLSDVAALGGLRASGWKRTGIGDLVVQAAWMRNYPQERMLLQDVRVQARFGVVAPTGEKQDDDLLLAFPFGNDGAWALQFAGGLDLDFGYCVRGGVDVEFLYMFGNKRCRRVKTTAEQTDLFFLTEVPAYREFGLGQQYNVYLESYFYNTSFKLNYQFLKRNDDRLDSGSDRIDSVIANSAPSLFDWTAHSLIFMIRHDLFRDDKSYRAFPSLGAFIKYGFNGKRALLANTVGFQLNVDF